jgi:hypothetical protein
MFSLCSAKRRASEKDLPVSYYKKRQKSPEQETGLWKRERLKVLNDT